MNIQYLTVLYGFFLLVSTSSYAMWSLPEDISPTRKEIRSRIKKEIVSGFLKIEEGNNAIFTQCQQPAPLVRPMAAMADCRERIAIPKWPYSVHGVIEASFSPTFSISSILNKPKTFRASGALIGPHLVLTCAHVLYDHKTKQKASKVVFIPATDKEREAPYGRIEVSRFYVPESYLPSVKNGYDEKTQDDYGLLILKDDVSQKTGYFGLGIINKETLSKREVDTAGYPADKGNSTSYEMSGNKGKIQEVNDNYIISNAHYVFPGQSGSLVWVNENNNYYGVGIVASRVFVEEAPKETKITYINKDRFNQIQEWIRESGVCKQIGLFTQELNLSQLYCSYQTNDYSSAKQESFAIAKRGEYNNGDFIVTELIRYNFLNLNKLNLFDNSLTSQSAQLLVKAKWPHLKELHLGKNNISQRFTYSFGGADGTWIKLGIEALAQADFPQLKKLNLENNFIWHEGVRILTTARWWNQLEELNLKGNQIGNKGIGFLVENWGTRLESLALGDNNIDDEGMRAFSTITNCQLKELIFEEDKRPLYLEDRNKISYRVLNNLFTTISTLKVLDLRKDPANEITFKDLETCSFNVHLEKIILHKGMYFPQKNRSLKIAEILEYNDKSSSNINKLQDKYVLFKFYTNTEKLEEWKDHTAAIHYFSYNLDANSITHEATSIGKVQDNKIPYLGVLKLDKEQLNQGYFIMLPRPRPNSSFPIEQIPPHDAQHTEFLGKSSTAVAIKSSHNTDDTEIISPGRLAAALQQEKENQLDLATHNDNAFGNSSDVEGSSSSNVSQPVSSKSSNLGEKRLLEEPSQPAAKRQRTTKSN